MTMQMDLFNNNENGNVRNASDLNLAPLDATFRDSNKTILHSWFPYLEGYSPHFVRKVQNAYLPNAKRIIEPFCGSGTTPIVLGLIGIDCAYSEANPVMALIISTKLRVLQADNVARRLLFNHLSKIADTIEDRLSEVLPDDKLKNSYKSCFESSVYFDDLHFEQILRLRTLEDQIRVENGELVADVFLVAVLSILILSSKLKRAGDLRFKTPKELKIMTPLPINALKERLKIILAELPHLGHLIGVSWMASASAQDLGRIEGAWDGVITSPPYLNGTNYIRNARLELWYSRSITSKIGLRDLRDIMITSGINDVNAHTFWAPATSGVARVVSELKERAYDTRIAMMVGGYFHDMRLTFKAIFGALAPGARACIDIGDSIYAGVHVPTDDLLTEVAEDVGFIMNERVHLRERISKGGDRIRQTLLVFKRPNITSSNSRLVLKNEIPLTVDFQSNEQAVTSDLKTEIVPTNVPAVLSDYHWKTPWEAFKRDLPHQCYPYSKRNWGGAYHSMCSYQGKMKPALAHHLVKIFSQPGELVIDPFSGAGTIPLEASFEGRRSLGLDISELGYILSLGKLGEIKAEAIDQLLKDLAEAIESKILQDSDYELAAKVDFNGSIVDFYHQNTFREILIARKFFLNNQKWYGTAAWGIVCSSLMHILHGNRPYALSRHSHPITPYKPTGPTEYRALMPNLRDKIDRLLADDRLVGRKPGQAHRADCTEDWPVESGSADAVITSPPFFDSTKFYMTNWLRYWFTGWERHDFDTRPNSFLEKRQKKSFTVYEKFFQQAARALRPTGVLVMHLGRSPKCDMMTELTKIAIPTFTVVDVFTEGVGHCESHGIRDKGITSAHDYLVLVPHR
jgi:DNA modification methylase